MDNPAALRNELRPNESLADCLQRQMQEAQALDYWTAVRVHAEREEAERRQAQSLSTALFGFPLF